MVAVDGDGAMSDIDPLPPDRAEPSPMAPWQKPPANRFATLVPELAVRDLAASLHFWCGLLGFRIAYERPEKGFAYLERAGAQVMLETRHGVWETGPLELPFGRGVNFQIFVEDLAPLLDALAAARWPLFEAPEEAWYRIGDQEGGQRQFLVQDPDGYLLRFAQALGRRPAKTGATR